MLHYQIELMSFQNMSLLELVCSRNGNKQTEATSAYKYERKLFKILLTGLEIHNKLTSISTPKEKLTSISKEHNKMESVVFLHPSSVHPWCMGAPTQENTAKNFKKFRNFVGMIINKCYGRLQSLVVKQHSRSFVQKR